MNKSLIALLLCFGLLSAPLAVGHGGPGHSHEPIKEARAKEIALSVVSDLVGQRKVDESWKSRSPSIGQKKFGERMEWVATFDNPKIKDAAKKRLYVFLSLSGEVLGANHTGK